MKHNIEEFSSIFAFGHSASSSIDEGSLCFEISSCREKYDQIFDSALMLGPMYQEHFFESVVEFLKKKEIFSSKEKFMRFMLSRCMKLSETPTLFNFLVVCAYVDNIVFGVCNEDECFAVIKMASKCITAIFNRRYVDLFDEENGFEGFDIYCQKLNATVLDPCEDSESDSEDSLDLEGFIPPDTDEVIGLLKSVKEMDDLEFSLNDFEKKLLYERDELPSDIDPADDIFIPINDGSVSLVYEIESLNFAMQNLDIKSIKVSERLNDYCPLCQYNCFKYAVLVAKELKIEI